MRLPLNLPLALAVLLFALLPALPASADTTYTIAPGDTLWSIASLHGVSVDAIVTANGIANPNYIQAGQRLTIPTAGGPAATPAPAPQPAPVTTRGPGKVGDAWL